MAPPWIKLPNSVTKGPLDTPAARERAVNTHLRRALFAILARDYAVAEESLADAVRTDSNSLDAYLALAGLYRDRGEIGRSIRVHQNLLLRRDLDSERRLSVLTELARDFEQGGFLRRAVASYEEILSEQPRNLDALRAMPALLAALREFPKAIAMAKRLARAEKKKTPEREAALLLEMAELDHQEGRTAEARKAVKAALRKNPSNAAALILLGVLEAERGCDKAAVAAWIKVPELSRVQARDLYPRLEAAFASIDKAREYEELLRGLVEEQPGDAAASLALASYLDTRGDSQLALDALAKLLERDPGNLYAQILRGRILLRADRKDEVPGALADLLRALEGHPGMLDLEMLKGEILE